MALFTCLVFGVVTGFPLFRGNDINHLLITTDVTSTFEACRLTRDVPLSKNLEPGRYLQTPDKHSTRSAQVKEPPQIRTDRTSLGTQGTHCHDPHLDALPGRVQSSKVTVTRGGHQTVRCFPRGGLHLGFLADGSRVLAGPNGLSPGLPCPWIIQEFTGG